ncbi:MAG: OmpH family outer membrane protein, partial [Candidatus Magnetominusculus sp. LBB02]|nr:OmpH family outer membrane protein [Candidatus Magnetominusculus sp. LBB02]
FAALAIALLIPISLQAETLKVGVFDIHRVMNEASAVAAYRQRYQNTLELKRKPLAATEEELKQLREKLDKGSLKPDEAMALENEFNHKALTARHQREDLDAELMQMDRWLKAQVYKDVSEILQELNKKEDYTVILERGVVAYYKNTVDITSRVIELYERKKP